MTTSTTPKRFVGLAAFLLACCLMFVACAQTLRFGPSDVVPAAKGQVSISRDKNNNYHMDLRVFHLADPGRLQPPRQLYIVWMESANNEVKNIGQLTTGNSMLSKTMKSVLHTVSAVKPSRIYITAEDDGSLQYPMGTNVLSTSYN